VDLGLPSELMSTNSVPDGPDADDLYAIAIPMGGVDNPFDQFSLLEVWHGLITALEGNTRAITTL
jgi:hypothetical protein